MTIQHNLMVIAAGKQVNQIKDRSANLEVSYNWIEGGNRQLDLVDGPTAIQWERNYHNSWVFGNVMIEYGGYDNTNIALFGGDSPKIDAHRRGTLFFYNNTVVSNRGDDTTLVMLSHPYAFADIRNNAVWTPNGRLYLMAAKGTSERRNNWFSNRFLTQYPENTQYQADRGGNIFGTNPGFANPLAGDFRPLANSPLVNGSTSLATGSPAVIWEYFSLFTLLPRPAVGIRDIGALEYKP